MERRIEVERMELRPRKPDDRGGWLAMPLVRNVPKPRQKGWKKVKCPECGKECWKMPDIENTIKILSLDGAVCTECALWKGVKR